MENQHKGRNVKEIREGKRGDRQKRRDNYQKRKKKVEKTGREHLKNE